MQQTVIKRLAMLSLLFFPLPAFSQQRPYWQHLSESVPLQCQPSIVHLNWQWRANAKNGNLREESPLAAIDLGMGVTREQALVKLQRGQRQNLNASRLYYSCAEATGGFYFLFLAASQSDVACTPSSLGEHLAWIYSQDQPVVVEAITQFDRALAETSEYEQDKGVLKAYSRLLYRQRHNGDVLALMRACFREDPEAFFNVARSVVR